MINSGDEQLKITQKQKQQRHADAKKEIKLKVMHQHEKNKIEHKHWETMYEWCECYLDITFHQLFQDIICECQH